MELPIRVILFSGSVMLGLAAVSLVSGPWWHELRWGLGVGLCSEALIWWFHDRPERQRRAQDEAAWLARQAAAAEGGAGPGADSGARGSDPG